MKIRRLKINSDLNGLNPITLDRIGSIVAFVGKNGAGKTRILNLLPNYLGQISTRQILAGFYSDIPEKLGINAQYLNRIRGLLSKEIQLMDLEFQISLRPNNKELLDRYKNLQNTANVVRGDLHQYQVMINQTDATLKSTINDYISVINMNEFLNIGESTQGTSDQLMELLENPNYIYSVNENTIIKEGAVYYLKYLANKLAYEKLKCKTSDDLEKNSVYIDFKLLKDAFNIFLGKELMHEMDESNMLANMEGVSGIRGKITFNGGDIVLKEFSPGQKILFAFSFYIYITNKIKKTKLKDKIFIIDEIENHLHPEIQILLLDKLKEIVSESGQLWLSTHSINILSHLSLDEIYFVEDGKILTPGSIIPEKAYDALMGNETHKVQLNYFVKNVSNWAFSNFMVECFDNPAAVVGERKNDPQIELFKRILAKKESVEILDYGAGKGRLFKEIEKDIELKKRIIYYAFDPIQANVDYLKNIGVSKAMNSIDSIIGVNYDLIIMMNVLHEMFVGEWEKTFHKLKDRLKDDGLLIIIEDKFIPKGEMPNEIGFLILSLEELKLLFNMNNVPSSLSLEQKEYKDRLLCTLFSKDQININNDSIINSLEFLRDRCYSEAKDVRNDKTLTKYKKGHLWALYTQLHMNSKIALEKIR